jgi:ABC-type transport system involved in multi-copper enzyme maturation permease subunit
VSARFGTWTAGLGNQTRREAATWWATGRWWRQGLVWLVVLAGLFALMYWFLPAMLAEVDPGAGPAADLTETAAQFAELATLVTAVGVIILANGLLLDDQRDGVLEWLLSKPLARPSLVVAKLAGHASGLLVALVLMPSVALYALLTVAASEPWPLGRFLGAMAILGSFVVFHLALVLALSALTRSRGVVLAVPLALLVGADVVLGAVPALAHGAPYVLGRIAGALLATGQLVAVGPLAATAVWTLLLLTVAVWRFTQQEP